MDTKKKSVVIVDEDINELAPFVIELQMRGINAIQYDSADSCMSKVQELDNVDLFLVDVMLATEGGYPPEKTGGGLLTGLLLAQDLRPLFPDTPITFFSAASLQWIKEGIETTIKSIGNSALLRKGDFDSTYEFGEVIEQILEAGKYPVKKDNRLRKLWDAIILQPNISGVGIDLKKFNE